MDAAFLPALLWENNLHTASEVAKRLVAERDALKDERDQLKREGGALRVQLGELNSELEHSRRNVQAVKNSRCERCQARQRTIANEAKNILNKHARHAPDCHQVFNASLGVMGSPCDCGLEEALRRLQ